MPEAVLDRSSEDRARATIWSGAVLRADDNDIVIGEETSVQDNAVLHVIEQLTVVGRGCTIGHLAHLEGCTVEDEALVGTGSIAARSRNRAESSSWCWCGRSWADARPSRFYGIGNASENS